VINLIVSDVPLFYTTHGYVINCCRQQLSRIWPGKLWASCLRPRMRFIHGHVAAARKLLALSFSQIGCVCGVAVPSAGDQWCVMPEHKLNQQAAVWHDDDTKCLRTKMNGLSHEHIQEFALGRHSWGLGGCSNLPSGIPRPKITSNLSKAHVTHDSSGPVTLAICVGLQQ